MDNGIQQHEFHTENEVAPYRKVNVERVEWEPPVYVDSGGAVTVAYECRARAQGTAGGNLPAECDWPVCGCDEYADKVIAALEEMGAFKEKETGKAK